MTLPIKHIIAKMFNHSNDWKFILLRDWPTIIGDLAEHVSIEKIENDTLILQVQNSCWLQELYLLSPLLLSTINKKLDKAYIKKLRFKQKGIVTRHEQPQNKQQKNSPTSMPSLSPQERQALARIGDPQLQMALKEFLYRCHREK
jgi:Dna[CI] antecedent DciA-like protein